MLAARPRLLALNQYYRPAPEADGQLLAELCEALIGEYDVTVVTGRSSGASGPGWSSRGGVRVVRVPSAALQRTRLSFRALNYLTYIALALPAGGLARRPDVILCMTNPPFLGVAALLLARRFQVPLVVVSQDVYPEVAIALGQLHRSPLIEALDRSTRFYLQRADRIVAIGETMRRRLEEKGTPPERISVIPNWVDTTVITPQAHDNDWSRLHGLAGRFVVMHSGNVGHAQNLDALVCASALLGDLDDLVVTIVGAGAGHTALARLAAELRANKVRLLPYQPRSVLSQSLSAASIHVVGLAAGLAGYVVPSRVYGILAAGRPVIVAAEAESETAELIRRAECGVVVPPGDPDALAAIIRRAHAGELDLERMGRRAREHAVAEADREVAVARYRALLRDVRAA